MYPPWRNIKHVPTLEEHQTCTHPGGTSNMYPPWRNIKHIPTLEEHQTCTHPGGTSNMYPPWRNIKHVPTPEELSEHGQATASLHRSPEGKRSGERKRPTFHPPRPGTVYVQPGQHWYCFEGNLGETAERRSEARMGLSERFDAILSIN